MSTETAPDRPAALARLGLTREAVQAMAWRQQVRAAETIPPPPRAYRSPRAFDTHYLDGEEQRAKKAMLHANEALICGLIMQGFGVIDVALVFGVTDQAIRNRMDTFGVKVPPHRVAIASKVPAQSMEQTPPWPEF